MFRVPRRLCHIGPSQSLGSPNESAPCLAPLYFSPRYVPVESPLRPPRYITKTEEMHWEAAFLVTNAP